jgi:glycosyltransferase involved in cell wall biosynthesis
MGFLLDGNYYFQRRNAPEKSYDIKENNLNHIREISLTMSNNPIVKVTNQFSRFRAFSKLFSEILREQGSRPALALVFKRISDKLDPPPPEIVEEIPEIIEEPEIVEEPRYLVDILNEYYDRWREWHCPRQSDLDQMAATVPLIKHQPVISVVMSTFNNPEYYLTSAIASVQNQVYPHWELCIADDASTEPHIKEILSGYAAADPRIKVVFRPVQENICAAANSALELATGEFVTVLESDAILTPDALYQIAIAINGNPKVDLIYSDEDKIDEDDNLREPCFKPDWSGNGSYLFWMYGGHLCAYRRSLLETVGGFRLGFEGSQDYDLLLRTTAETDQIIHVAKILYHRRINLASQPPNPGISDYIYQSTKNALEQAIYAMGQRLFTEDIPGTLGHYPLDDEEYGHEKYQVWLTKHGARPSDIQQMKKTVAALKLTPLISLVMPVFNPPETFLKEAIASIVNQIYPYWELCIADDCSTEPYVKQVLEEYAAIDSRIKIVIRAENGHISAASNSALELATGEFVSLLDHDDVLTPDALYQVALMINQHPDADLIYSDEDKIDEENKLKGPYFKPEWCPDSFLSRMYVGHLGTYRRSLIEKIGGFRVGYEGSQDYDLVLRFTEQTDKIYHIPKVLYHWRIHLASAASSSDAKPYAYEAAKKALTEAIYRRGEPGTVTDVPNYLGHYIIRYEITDYKRVSIIIPTRNLGKMLDQCLDSIFTKTTYPNYEVIVIDNGSTEETLAEVIAKWQEQEPTRFKCYPLDIPFNFSKLNNYAVTQAQGDYLLFLNNDTEVIKPDWIDAMVEQAQRPSIGAVGGLLLYPDDTIQHAGVILGLGELAVIVINISPAIPPVLLALSLVLIMCRLSQGLV